MAKLLVAAQDLASGVVKGDIVEVYPDSYGWGNKERLPNFIRVIVSDKTKAEADQYLQDIRRVLDYTLDANPEQGVRITIAVDARFSGNFDRSVKQEIKDFILSGGPDELVVTQHDATATSITVDIALPNDDSRIDTLKEFRAAINDIFTEQIGYRRYFFNPTAVDTVIAGGGEITVTAAQAGNNIVDRFA